MMEIGSFIGLDFRKTGEFYPGNVNIARLNSARAGIYYACNLYGCKSVQIPYYLCPTVKNFLVKKGIEVNSYFINENFEPVNLIQKPDQAVLLVNYFGINSYSRAEILSKKFKNVIFDNSAAFFNKPIPDCYNVYSPRKFFGVPDGCYVIGENAHEHLLEIDQDYSSHTASFFFKNIEYGTNAAYKERMANEDRIDQSDILKMSLLTTELLNCIHYSGIHKKRKENFFYAHSLYKDLNLIDPFIFLDNDCAPMFYPLIVEDPNLAEKLRARNIYVGRLWKSVLAEVPDNSFEAKLSKYLIPMPIDQRYSSKELDYCYAVFKENYNKK